MKKIFICFILLLGVLLNGCGINGGELVWDKSALYEINDSTLSQKYYFQYPLNAEIVYKDNAGYINYQFCKIDFSKSISIEIPQDAEKKTANINNHIRESFFKDNVLFLYSAYSEDKKFVFFSYNNGEDVSNCVSFIDKVVDSFTDKPFYYNENFSFKVDILPDYKMEDLPSGEGILMKKNFDKEICKDAKTQEEYPCDPYGIEISVSASNNIMQYKDVYDFVSKKYEGYNIEFLDNNGVNGIFVDEGNGKEAIRHFFMMSNDAQILYEALLKSPSVYYTNHKEEFDQLVKSIRI